MKIIIHTSTGSQELSKKAEPVITAASIKVNVPASHPGKQESHKGPGKIIPKSAKGITSAQLQEVEQIRVIQGQLYNQKAMACNDLVDRVDTVNATECKALVDKILEIRAIYNANAEKIRHFEQHGELPAPEPEKPKLSELDKVELIRKRQNVASQISKTKNAVTKYQHQPAKVVKYENKMARLQAELQEIDELLR